MQSNHSNAPPSGSGDASAEPPTKEIIWSGWIDVLKRAPVFETSESLTDGTTSTVLIWELPALLGRSKDRLRAPFLYFIMNIDLQASPSVTKEDGDDPYLPSLIPAPLNLLEHLNDFSNLNVSLPSDRLRHFFPSIQVPSTRTPKPKIEKPKRYRILPALTARIHYSKLNMTPSKPSVVAVLDTEMAPGLPNGIVVESVILKLEDGEAEDLGQGITPSGPKKCQSREILGYVFRLIPTFSINRSQQNVNSSAINKGLDITINATILSSSYCKPQIEMRWHTQAEFSSALNPLHSGPGQGILPSKRPSNFPDASVASSDKNELLAPAQRSWSKSTESRLGLTLTFTAQTEKLIYGNPFYWEIFVINKSSETRKLTIGITPVSSPPRKHAAKESNSSATSIAIRDAQESGPAQIISLSTDIKIGPLAPGSCQETRLKLLPLRAGVLRLEGIRITDVVANEYIDIRQDDLPDVIVEQDVEGKTKRNVE